MSPGKPLIARLSWPKWRLSERGGVFGLLGIWLISLLLILVFHDPRLVNSVSAVSERVQFRVAQPMLAAFPLDGFRMMSVDPFATGDASDCRTGIFVPAPGAVVEYLRGLGGTLQVTVHPAQDNRPAGRIEGAHALDDGALHFVADPACGYEGPRRLPLWGAAAIGDDIRGATGLGEDASAILIEGEISVSARSISLFGLLTPTMYHIDTIPLPTGSRISEVDETDLPDGALWAGFVEVDPDARGVAVHAVTDARNLKIYLPGQGAGADQLRVGLLVPVFQDPYLLIGQILLGSLLVVGQALIAIMDFALRRKDQ